MRVQAEPSEIFTEVDRARVRVWNGITDEGVQCFLFVARVAVRTEDDPLSLARELTEVPMGTAELAAMR
jgi:hypothetical protein